MEMFIVFLEKHGIEWFGILATISLAIYIKVIEKRMNKEHSTRERKVNEDLKKCHEDHLESKEKYTFLYEKIFDRLTERDKILIEKLDEVKEEIRSLGR